MVQLTEFRIVLPLSVEEYRVAQMYMVTKLQQQNTNGKEGVQVLKNEPFESPELGRGMYTHKVYHLQSKLPSWVSMLAPPSALRVEEEAWNAYPKCKTVMTCPYFTNFKVVVDTIHVEDNGTSENVHNLPAEKLAKRKVDMVDIMNDPGDYWSYMIGSSINLSGFQSKVTARGPLLPSWKETAKPIMTAYKLVTIDISYWAFGSRLEQAFLSAERALFLEGNKRCFAWIDDWISLTPSDVRRMELASDAAINEKFRTSEGGTTTTKGSPLPETTSENIVKGDVVVKMLQPHKEVGKEPRKADNLVSYRELEADLNDNDETGGGALPRDEVAVNGIAERAITVNV